MAILLFIRRARLSDNTVHTVLRTLGPIPSNSNALDGSRALIIVETCTGVILEF